MITYTITRQSVPHLRCGICDEQIERGERSRYVEDERVHLSCARRFWDDNVEERDESDR